MTLFSEAEPVDLQEPRSWRRTKNRLATVLMVLAMVLVMLPLGWVIYAVIDRGEGPGQPAGTDPALAHDGLRELLADLERCGIDTR